MAGNNYYKKKTWKRTYLKISSLKLLKHIYTSLRPYIKMKVLIKVDIKSFSPQTTCKTDSFDVKCCKFDFKLKLNVLLSEKMGERLILIEERDLLVISESRPPKTRWAVYVLWKNEIEVLTIIFILYIFFTLHFALDFQYDT